MERTILGIIDTPGGHTKHAKKMFLKNKKFLKI